MYVHSYIHTVQLTSKFTCVYCSHMCSSVLFEASAEAHMLHTCESCQCRTRICVSQPRTCSFVMCTLDMYIVMRVPY